MEAGRISHHKRGLDRKVFACLSNSEALSHQISIMTSCSVRPFIKLTMAVEANHRTIQQSSEQTPWSNI